MKRLIALFCLMLAVLGSQGNKPVYTQVTFMYDIKRGDLGAQFKRTYQYYLSYFDQMLQTDSNLIVFGGKDLQAYVWQRRKPDNTVFVLKEIETFKDLWYYPYVEKLRQKRMQDPAFPYKHYPQFALEYYNPIIMSKLYILTFALEYDKFNTDIFIWTDGGYMHQFPKNLVAPDNLIKKIYQLMQPQWLFYTYNDPNMFLGYEKGSARYLNRPVQGDQAILASNFGGYIETLRDVRCTYENFLRIVVQNGDMNSDESVLSMMPIKYPYLFPNTFGLYLNDLYQKFHIYMDVNRKPQHSRLFRGDFDNQGNIHVIENKVFTKYIVVGKKQEASMQLTQKKPTSEVRKPSVQVPKVDEQKKEEQSVLVVKSTFYKQIFYHQSIFLISMLIFYIVIVCNRPREYKGHFFVPTNDRETIIYGGPASNQ